MGNPDRAYLADCPTLLHYDKTYGEGVGASWIYGQVLALFGASSCKDEGMAKGIWLFAESFANEAKGYKLSELMLFFARYHAGKYDGSYTSFDTKRIGNCFFNHFVKERNFELEKIHRDECQKEMEERRFTPPESYTSWSWYQELKKRAELGDIRAKEALIHG